MSETIPEYIERERTARGWRRSDLARAIGYENLSKGSRRIQELEEAGICDRRLLEKIVAALGLDPVKVNEIIDEDHRQAVQAWQEWADEPVPALMIWKAMPSIWLNKHVPDGATQQQMLDLAREASRVGSKAAVLIPSRRLRINFHDGELTGWIEVKPTTPAPPHIRINGRPFPLEFTGEVPTA
jgi:hypothetical protein